MKKYDEIAALIAKGNVANNTNATNRLNPVPIDKSSIFNSFATASEYALNSGVAYEGQVIAVTEDNSTKVYVLDSSVASGLKNVGILSASELCGLNDMLSSLSSVLSGQISVLSNYAISIEISANGISSKINSICSDLSNEINKKIWIEDQISGISGYNNLSILKIGKDNYDQLVGQKEESIISNCLYIVDSDYIDAYGQAISNVIMSAEALPATAYLPSEATNKNYVDALCASLSAETKLSIENVIKTKIDYSGDIKYLSSEHDQLSTNLSLEIQAKSGGDPTILDKLSNNIEISTFYDTFNKPNGYDQIKSELVLSTLYSIIKILGYKQY